MELLPIVTPHSFEPTGIVLPRAEAIKQGAWCQSTNVFVLNSKGEVLCHQRSLQKERFPGVWSTHLGGHVGHGETYETNAHKELQEEAGIEVHPEKLISWRTSKIDKSRLWVRDFVVLHDAPVDILIPQPGEVESFSWKPIDAILHEKNQNPDMWLAGTHDLMVEYWCMRAVLAAAHTLGKVQGPTDIHTWWPTTQLPA